MKNELKMIKKLYGEQMAHFCRDYFATILETKGLLLKLLVNSFEPSHSLYQDIVEQGIESEFKNYIYSLIDVENNNEIKVKKTPKELLSEAGYDLYECHSEEDIQKFKKYYAPGEELCTFNGGRLKRCYVFFAVKKDALEIKREDYQTPERQDKYGTSVISIQFTKDSSHTLSIKNRYNHTVNNPDATFSNNLDNIILGLTESFANEYGLVQEHINNGFEIEGYVRASDGKYYKYNYEINNIYYCSNNIIIDNFEVKRYEKEKYIIFDYFILDLVNKRVTLYDKKIKDSFIETVKDIEKIEIEKEENNKVINLTLKNGNKITIVIDENNRLIKLENLHIKKIADYFLRFNTTLQSLDLPKVEEIGNNFLDYNELLQSLNLPNLKKVGDSFLSRDNILKKVNLPNLEEVGSSFLYISENLKKISLPKLQKAGDYFLGLNYFLQELDLPNLQEVGDKFLSSNKCLHIVNLPNLQKIGHKFMYSNKSLQILNLPKVEEIGSEFLYNNIFMGELDLPNLLVVGNRFFYYNNSLRILYLPNLQKIGDYFFGRNNSLQEIALPNLQKVGNCFLVCNEYVQEFYAQNLKQVGVDFFKNNYNDNLRR